MGSSTFPPTDRSCGFLGFASSGVDAVGQLKVPVVVSGDDNLLFRVFLV
jgi:hypothetical protein